MNCYTIETGKYRCRYQPGKNAAEAAVSAFARRAPAAPAILTRARMAGGTWEYLSTASLLERAGYTVTSKGDQGV